MTSSSYKTYSRNETTRFVEKQRYESNREIDGETTPHFRAKLAVRSHAWFICVHLLAARDPALPRTDDQMPFGDRVDDIAAADDADEFVAGNHGDALDFALGQQHRNIANGCFFCY